MPPGIAMVDVRWRERVDIISLPSRVAGDISELFRAAGHIKEWAE
jgi:hypothetical protein